MLPKVLDKRLKIGLGRNKLSGFFLMISLTVRVSILKLTNTLRDRKNCERNATESVGTLAEPLVSDVRQSQSLLRCGRQANLDHGIWRLPK